MSKSGVRNADMESFNGDQRIGAQNQKEKHGVSLGPSVTASAEMQWPNCIATHPGEIHRNSSCTAYKYPTRSRKMSYKSLLPAIRQGDRSSSNKSSVTQPKKTEHDAHWQRELSLPPELVLSNQLQIQNRGASGETSFLPIHAGFSRNQSFKRPAESSLSSTITADSVRHSDRQSNMAGTYPDFDDGVFSPAPGAY